MFPCAILHYDSSYSGIHLKPEEYRTVHHLSVADNAAYHDSPAALTSSR